MSNDNPNPISATTRSKTGSLRSEEEQRTKYLRVDDPVDTKKRTNIPKRGETVNPDIPDLRSPGFQGYRDREIPAHIRVKSEPGIDVIERPVPVDLDITQGSATSFNTANDSLDLLNESQILDESINELDKTVEEAGVNLQDITSDSNWTRLAADLSQSFSNLGLNSPANVTVRQGGSVLRQSELSPALRPVPPNTLGGRGNTPLIREPKFIVTTVATNPTNSIVTNTITDTQEGVNTGNIDESEVDNLPDLETVDTPNTNTNMADPNATVEEPKPADQVLDELQTARADLASIELRINRGHAELSNLLNEVAKNRDELLTTNGQLRDGMAKFRDMQGQLQDIQDKIANAQAAADALAAGPSGTSGKGKGKGKNTVAPSVTPSVASSVAPSRASSISGMREQGLPSILASLAKPVKVLAETVLHDPEQSRAQGYLQQLTAANIWQQLKEDRVIQGHEDKMDVMLNMIANLTNSVEKIRKDHQTSVKSMVEKTTPLLPNPNYPVANASDELYTKAVQSMMNSVKTTERSFTFRDQPYNFLLECCSHANAVASNFGLSQMQQFNLILSFIPSTSDQFIELKEMNDLHQLFRFANLNSSTSLTRGEAETQLEQWHLDTSSSEALATCISKLKRLIAEVAGAEHKGNNRYVYIEACKKCRREKLPAFILRGLDEARLRMDEEHQVDALHAILLAALKPMVGYKQKQATPMIQKSEAEVMMNSTVEYEGPKQSQGQQGQGKKGQVQGKNKKKGKFSKGGKRQPTYTVVKPYPTNLPVTMGGGNTLSKHFEQWFENHCWKCGKSNHKGLNCLKYPNNNVMTLCKICRRGLHDQCKQGERVNSNQTSNASSRSNTPGPGKGKGKGKGGGGWNKKGGSKQAKGVTDQDIRIHMLEQQVNLLCMNMYG